MVRYSWLSDRSRSIHQERFNLLELNLIDSQSKGDRLHDLNHLLSDVLKHHHQIHDILVLIYLAIVFFVLDMLCIAFAIANNSSWLNHHLEVERSNIKAQRLYARANFEAREKYVLMSVKL